ncbi:MAG: thioredoxin family protein [Myxococcales bacterium]|nr:thioredoxin family protein [Myxococcales bacterium]
MARTPSVMVALGSALPSFALEDVVTGAVVRRDDYSGRPLLVVFTCNHCPFVIHVRPVLVALLNEAIARSDGRLGVVALNANDEEGYPQDGPGPMRELATSEGWAFPYLFDRAQTVARAFGAACTPDFFLYDGDHRLAYRGQLDGARPGNGVPVTGVDLRGAIDAVLDGRAPSVEQRPSLGCNIKWKAGNEPG